MPGAADRGACGLSRLSAIRRFRLLVGTLEAKGARPTGDRRDMPARRESTFPGSTLRGQRWAADPDRARGSCRDLRHDRARHILCGSAQVLPIAKRAGVNLLASRSNAWGIAALFGAVRERSANWHVQAPNPPGYSGMFRVAFERLTPGDRATFCAGHVNGEKLVWQVGWGARIRTWEWRNQNPLPYRLATPHR
jgi:hypothetical protein